MKLKRDLGFIDVFSVAAGAMISSGLFILPALAYVKSGPSVFLAYVLAGILVLPSVFSKAELATAMPKSGGDYFFVERSMGSGFGTLAGISTWFSISFKSAFALLGIGIFASLLHPMISQWIIKLIAVVFCLIFMFVNYKGVKHAGRFQVFLVSGLILILLIFVALGLKHIDLDNYRPFFKGGFREFFATAGLIFVSYGGLTKVASISEEVKNPNKNIPLGMFAAFIGITVLYALSIFVLVGILGNDLIQADGSAVLTPLSNAASTFAGNWGKIVLAVAALLAFISTGNAGVLSASRAPMAMSRDNLLPPFFLKASKKNKTPVNSILITGLFMIAVILFLDLKMLIKTASTMKIILFGSINLAVIIMRESRIQNYRPKFKTPFYPIPQIFALVAYIFLLIDMGKIPLIISFIFFAIGLTWFWFYGRINNNRQSAMYHLIKRITSKELLRYDLEDELREIVLEREDIKKDRFDKIIEDCPIYDLQEKMKKDEFYEFISDRMSEKLKISKSDMYNKLCEREKESSMVLTSDLAVPHIIIDGQNKFQMAVVRNKKGIFFEEGAPNINTVFVIIGTRDERTFHLKALAAIAQIVHEKDFHEKWMKAKNKESLRDLVLLAKRYRNK